MCSFRFALRFSACREQAFGSVYVNANGNLTFGAGDSDFTESDGEFRDGPARIAGLWHDLQPVDPFGNPQGSVFFNQTNDSFTVTWENVPEWGFPSGVGSNTFAITLNENSEPQCVAEEDDDDDSFEDDNDRPDAVIDYVALSSPSGLAGVTGGLAVTSGAEQESRSFGSQP